MTEEAVTSAYENDHETSSGLSFALPDRLQHGAFCGLDGLFRAK
jgi:hypothetical protein